MDIKTLIAKMDQIESKQVLKEGAVASTDQKEYKNRPAVKEVKSQRVKEHYGSIERALLEAFNLIEAGLTPDQQQKLAGADAQDPYIVSRVLGKDAVPVSYFTDPESQKIAKQIGFKDAPDPNASTGSTAPTTEPNPYAKANVTPEIAAGMKKANAPTATKSASAIPAGSYTVKTGDTISAIAKSAGTTVDAIMAANKQLSDPNRIQAGSKIAIPSKTAQSAQPAAPKSNAAPSLAAKTPAAPTEPEAGSFSASVAGREAERKKALANPKFGSAAPTPTPTTPAASGPAAGQDLVALRKSLNDTLVALKKDPNSPAAAVKHIEDKLKQVGDQLSAAGK